MCSDATRSYKCFHQFLLFDVVFYSISNDNENDDTQSCFVSHITKYTVDSLELSTMQ